MAETSLLSKLQTVEAPEGDELSPWIEERLLASNEFAEQYLTDFKDSVARALNNGDQEQALEQLHQIFKSARAGLLQLIQLLENRPPFNAVKIEERRAIVQLIEESETNSDKKENPMTYKKIRYGFEQRMRLNQEVKKTLVTLTEVHRTCAAHALAISSTNRRKRDLSDPDDTVVVHL